MTKWTWEILGDLLVGNCGKDSLALNMTALTAVVNDSGDVWVSVGQGGSGYQIHDLTFTQVLQYWKQIRDNQ